MRQFPQPLRVSFFNTAAFLSRGRQGVRSKASGVTCVQRLKPYLEPIRDIRVNLVNDTYAIIEDINRLVGLQRGLKTGID
jgi:hypothetical protein